MTLWEWLFWCRHPDFSFPQTRPAKGTYVVCLKCGEEFDYDWNLMQLVRTSGTSKPVKQKKIQANLEERN